MTRRSRWYTERAWAHLLYLTPSHASIYVENREHKRTIRTHPLLSIRAKHRTIATARLYQQFIQRLRDTSQFKSRIELLNTIALYLLIVRVSLSSHIPLLNEWQSLSKRTQSLRYNHEHHECKEIVFRLRDRKSKIETSLYRISSVKSRARTMRYNKKHRHSLRVYSSVTRWIEAIDSLFDTLSQYSLFRRREVAV